MNAGDPLRVRSRTVWGSPRFSLDLEQWSTVDGEVERPVIHHPGAVAIIAQPDPEHLLLVRQWRYSLRRWTLEIPAGTCTPGESPLATAERELREETGFAARELHEMLRVHPAPGVSDELLIIYRAVDLHAHPAARDHGELVAPHRVALRDLPAALGEVLDAKTMLALAMLGLPVRRADQHART